MPIKFVLIILLQLFIYEASSQSIPSYWMNRYDIDNYYETKDDNVEEITVNNKAYYASGESYKDKWIYKFKSPNQCNGQLFKNGELKSHFQYEFDSLKNIIKIINKSKIPLLGWEITINEFEYIGKKRMTEKHYNRKMQLMRKVEYYYDDDNLLTKLTINNSYETADYDHKGHSYTYKIFNSKNELVSKNENYFNLDKSEEIRNKYGDLTKLIWPTAKPNREVYHVLEYKYDKQNNWIKRSRYIVTNGKKELTSKIKRKIKYKDN